MGASTSKEAQALRPGDMIQYQGQNYMVSRDAVTHRNQFFNTDTGEIHNPYSIYTATPHQTNTVDSLSRRCQKCGGRNCVCR